LRRRRVGHSRSANARAIALVLAAMFLGVGCRQDMHDAPRYEPLEEATFFSDGGASRVFVADTVARGHLREDDHFYTGKVNGQLATEFPMPVTMEVMTRGQERFNVFCTPCHGRTGEGNGVIVQRGFRQPPSYHEDRLIDAPPGHFFDVMTNGFGAMQDYRSQVPVPDRWAIAAYIKALQFSRRAMVGDVPPAGRAALDGAPAVAAPRGQATPGTPPGPAGAGAPAAPPPPVPAAGGRPAQANE
jgi:cytochrome c553